MNRVIVVLKPTEHRKHLTSFHAAIVYIYNNNVVVAKKQDSDDEQKDKV